MTRRTNKRLIWIGFIAFLAIFPTIFFGTVIVERAGPDSLSSLVLEIVLGIELLLFFFCFWFYGWFARFSTFIGRPMLDSVGKPGANTWLNRGSSDGIRFFKAIGLWVEDPPDEK